MYRNIRPAFKKMLFPVQRKKTFFSIFFPNIIFTIFLPKQQKKREEKVLWSADWPQFWPAAGQETNFFLRVA